MDSFTRVAVEKREVRLSLEEQTVGEGNQRVCVCMIPSYIEWSRTEGVRGGATTARFNPLTEGRKSNCAPLVGTARAILDGHRV